MKGCTLSLIHREAEFRRFGVEDMLPQRIGRKQSIAARMPVRGVIWILWMVEDGDGDHMAAGVPGEGAPAAAC